MRTTRRETTATRAIPFLLAGLLLLLPSALMAQDDPFARTVGGDPGVATRIARDLLPSETPSKAQLRQYVEALRVLSLTTDVTLDDGRRRRTTALGSSWVPTGTKVRFQAEFARPRNGGSPVLRTLSIVPNNAIRSQDATIHRIDLDRNGNMHVRLTRDGRYIDLNIHKIYRDRAGNLVFRTQADNQGWLVNRFVPDFRITPNGTLQKNSKNHLVPWERGWETVNKNGRPVNIGMSLPLKRWPPRASDLVDLLGGDTGGRRNGGGGGGGAPPKPGFLAALPIRDVSVGLKAKTDPVLLKPKSERGWVALRSGEVDLALHGKPGKQGGIELDPRKRNDVRVKARVDGVVTAPEVKGKLLGLDVDVTGKLRGRIGGAHGTDLTVDVDAKGKADVAEVTVDVPGRTGIRFPRAGGAFVGGGSVRLRDGKKPALSLDPDNRVSGRVNGPLTLTRVPGTDGKPITLANGDEPVIRAGGQLDPNLKGRGLAGALNGGAVVNGTTTRDVKVRVGQDDRTVSTTIKQGARVEGSLTRDSETRGTLNVRGTAADTRIRRDHVVVSLPEVDVSLTGEATLGAKGELQDARGQATLTSRKPGTIDLPLGLDPAKAPSLRALLGPGSTVKVSGNLDDGTARVDANLKLDGANVRKGLIPLAALEGKGSLDLSTVFEIDPATFGGGADAAGKPVPLDLGLKLGLDKGASLSLGPLGSLGKIDLTDAASVSLDLKGEVDPKTGKPQLKGLDGVDVTIRGKGLDLSKLKQLTGKGVDLNLGQGEASVRIKNANIRVDANGRLKVVHEGISLELAPGTIELGR